MILCSILLFLFSFLNHSPSLVSLPRFPNTVYEDLIFFCNKNVYRILCLSFCRTLSKLSNKCCMQPVCFKFHYNNQTDQEVEKGGLERERLEGEGLKTEGVKRLYSLFKKPLDSRCHLQLYYQTIREVVYTGRAAPPRVCILCTYYSSFTIQICIMLCVQYV